MENSNSDELTEDEFDALLDAIEARKSSSGTIAEPSIESDSAQVKDHVDTAVSAVISVSDGREEITEDEFDAVLDKIAKEKATESVVGARDNSETDAVVDEYLTDLCAAESAAVAVKLAANLGIAQAAALHAELVAAVATTRDIRIEAADVESIDTAAIQLLYSFILDATGNGQSVEWSNPSANLVQNASLLGLTQHLRLAELGARAA